MNLPHNEFKKRLRDGDRMIGVWNVLNSTAAVEISSAIKTPLAEEHKQV